MECEHMVDVVFVVGPIRSKTRKSISRFINRLTHSSWNNVKVASVHFATEYDSKLCKNVFVSRTVDFTVANPVRTSALPQVQGNPLQHLRNFSFRDNAVKICFLMTNDLPFSDSYGEHTTQESINNDHVSGMNTTRDEQEYHEDPLLTCRQLAAMGVTLYCIDDGNQHTAFSRDMYTAFTYITGGQYIQLEKITNLQKMLQNIILEEISLEKLIGQMRDYLCVAWHRWGKKEATIPENIEDLTDNIVNYFHKTSIMSYEVTVCGNCPPKPSKLAKQIAESFDVKEARNIDSSQENWSADLNWISELCDELIPGYDAASLPKKQPSKVYLSQHKLVSRNQISRLLMRVLTRKPKSNEQLTESCRTPNNEENEVNTENGIKDYSPTSTYTLIIDSCDKGAVKNNNNNLYTRITKENEFRMNLCC